MTANNDEPTPQEVSEGEGTPVCPGCLTSLPPAANVCPKCLAPVTPIATIDPIERIWSMGHLYHRAAHGPASKLVLIGATLLGLEVVLFWCVIITNIFTGFEFPRIESWEDGIGLSIAVVVEGLFTFWIVKVWRNYFSRGKACRQRESSRTEGDDNA